MSEIKFGQTKAKKRKPKSPMKENPQHRPGGHHRLPLVGTESIKNLIGKETPASVASLPPPGSFFNEKMLWPNFLGSRPMVEALLSRLRHYCHTVLIDGPSLREPQG